MQCQCLSLSSLSCTSYAHQGPPGARLLTRKGLASGCGMIICPAGRCQDVQAVGAGALQHAEDGCSLHRPTCCGLAESSICCCLQACNAEGRWNFCQVGAAPRRAGVWQRQPGGCAGEGFCRAIGVVRRPQPAQPWLDRRCRQHPMGCKLRRPVKQSRLHANAESGAEMVEWTRLPQLEAHAACPIHLVQLGYLPGPLGRSAAAKAARPPRQAGAGASVPAMLPARNIGSGLDDRMDLAHNGCPPRKRGAMQLLLVVTHTSCILSGDAHSDLDSGLHQISMFEL